MEIGVGSHLLVGELICPFVLAHASLLQLPKDQGEQAGCLGLHLMEISMSYFEKHLLPLLRSRN